MATILMDIKTALGVTNDNLGFDQELLLFINSAKARMEQVGVDDFGDTEIVDTTDWPTFQNSTIFGLVKHMMVLLVRQSFDPIPSDTIAKAVEATIVELGGRLNHEIEGLAV